MASRNRYATQADVAALAGVSRATVSLVVKGSSHVSPDKRKRVLEAITQLGYVNNTLASSLAGNRSTLLVGLLVQSLSNPIFTEIHEATESVLVPRGHQLLVMRGGVDAEEEDAALHTLTSLRPDGIMLAGYAGSTQALYRAVRAVPAVSVTREILPPTEDLPTPCQPVYSVVNDDFAGATLAVEHLLELGHHHIVHLQLPTPLPYEGRVHAYTSVMSAHGLRARAVPTPITIRGARGIALAQLAQSPTPTAFFCGNDMQALGALDAVVAAGLTPGRDVSIVGYDNTPTGARAGLSTINQHTHQMGVIAARAMLRALGVTDVQEPSPPPPPTLIQRASSGPAPRS